MTTKAQRRVKELLGLPDTINMAGVMLDAYGKEWDKLRVRASKSFIDRLLADTPAKKRVPLARRKK